MRRIDICAVLLAVLGWAWFAVGVSAQPPKAAPPPMRNFTEPPPGANGPADAESETPKTFWTIFKAGGPVGLLIILLSVAAMALVIEHIVTIRAGVLMPPELGEEVHSLLVAGKLGLADQRCRMAPSFLSYVLGAGLAEVDGGWPAIEKAVEDATAEQSARLFRKIEYLSVIGNIAPLLGLLGTVFGIIVAFQELSASQGAPRAADLAEGIYLALVTTAEGLIVAIPSLAAFAVFRNRVDHLVAEVTYVAQHVFSPLKRNRAAPRPKTPASPQGPAPPPVGGGH